MQGSSTYIRSILIRVQFSINPDAIPRYCCKLVTPIINVANSKTIFHMFPRNHVSKHHLFPHFRLNIFYPLDSIIQHIAQDGKSGRAKEGYFRILRIFPFKQGSQSRPFNNDHGWIPVVRIILHVFQYIPVKNSGSLSRVYKIFFRTSWPDKNHQQYYKYLIHSFHILLSL